MVKRSAGISRAALWLLTISGLLGGIFLRPRVLTEREALGLEGEVLEGAAPGSGVPDSAAPPAAWVPTVMGVLRPIVLDALWLRAVRLQERGQFFESVTLTDLITALQPKIPEVWTFHARNLAYNIPAALPPGERYPWVLKGIELLRDEALLHNPRSMTVASELAILFQHKIGLDFDAAGFLYRSELARTFEVDPASSPGRALHSRWKLHAGVVDALGAAWGVNLDFRIASSHALYWADLGLGMRDAAIHQELQAFQRRVLRQTAHNAVMQLFTAGRAVKEPLGRRYAFLPDLRFLDPARQVVRSDKERLKDFPLAQERLTEVEADLQGKAVFFAYLLHGPEEARARQVEAQGVLPAAARSLESFLLENAWFLIPGLDAESGGEGPGRSALTLASFLDASALLDLAGEADAAKGFLSLARLVHEHWLAASEGRVPSFEQCRRFAVRRRLGRLEGIPEIWDRLAPQLKEDLRQGGDRPADTPGELLPAAGSLPFLIELLDPLWRAEGE